MANNSGAPRGRGMASFSSCSVACLLPLLLLAIAAFISPSQALVYNVGDRSWTLPPTMNYNFWSASKQFRVNDILRFSYPSEIHNVVQVTPAAYASCSAARPLKVYSNGNSLVRLSRRGTYYFICGIPGHCDAGMKMKKVKLKKKVVIRMAVHDETTVPYHYNRRESGQPEKPKKYW